MPHFLMITAAMLVATAASAPLATTPAAADHRVKSSDSYKQQRADEIRAKKRSARYKGWKRYRYGKYYYYYPYSRSWGPFAGPPGL